MFEVQSTPEAASVLSLEEKGPVVRECRMSAESGGPVNPVAIIGATRARDLRMPTDRGVGVTPQGEPRVGFEGPPAFAEVPVFLADPPRRLGGMTAVCPTTQFGVQQGIHPREGGLGNDRGVVVAPSPDEGVEASDEDLLGSSTEVPHFLFEMLEMGPLCGARGLDMGFESQRGSVARR